MKKANTQSPTSECPPNNNNNNKYELNLPGSEIKYVRTQSYPSTSRNLVEQVAVSSQQAISDKEYLSHIKRGAVVAAGGENSGMGRKPSTKDRSLKRQQSVSGEKKTRWLLTRKTWRYMADAGRKLIPEGVQNKPENVEKIEEHFQKLCQNEKKFLIWKRKLSYPGASGSFRRKNKNKVSKRPVTVGSPPTGSSADECEDGERPRKSTDDLIIKMLEKYLNLNSDIEENNDEMGETSRRSARASSDSKSNLSSRINSKRNNSSSTDFEGHDQASTSGRSSGQYYRHLNPPRSLKISSDGNSFTTTTTTTTPDGSDGSMALSLAADADSSNDPIKANVQEHSIWHPISGNDAIHSSLLIDTLKQYRKKNYSPYLNSDSISGDLLKDKVLLRKILNDIKTQQKYSKTIPRTESTRSLNISYSSSMSSLLTSTISSTFHNFVDFIDTKASSCRNTISRGFGDSNHGHSNVSISAYGSTTGKELRQHKSSSSADVVAGSGSKSSANVSSAFSVPISRSFNTTSPMMLSRPHQIYNQQKQIFASQQQQQMYQQQQQYSRSNRTISTTLKTITKTTSTTTISSASKQLPDSSSSNAPSSPASLPGILKKPVKTYKAIEIQTDGIPLGTLNALFNEYKKQVELERQEEEEQQGEGGRGSGNRKPSIDNKDVSQSVSDTIKRYLMMARKKPKDNDAANKFKRVNYDRNLRNIKAKGEITKPGDDEDLMKGCQTDSDWLEVLFGNSEELHRCYTSPIISPVVSTTSSTSPPPSIPSSPPSPAPGSSGGGSSGGLIQSGTQFLSSLFYHSGANNQQQSHSPTPSTSSASTVVAGGNSNSAMQKSKSSSNVGHYVSKKIFRSRSKSQTRSHVSQLLVPASSDVKSQWTPQSNGIWVTNTGKRVQLRDVFLPSLTEVERVILEKQAAEKIQQLGVTLTPQEASNQSTQKPHKRRVLLLKRKAVTTGIFDSSKGKDDYSNKGGLMFAIPLEQCIENDHNRMKEKKETRSSRSSLSSLLDLQHRDRSGSCDSLPAKAEFAEYLHNTFLPLSHTNIDRRNSHDDDEITNLAGVHNQVQQVPAIVLTCTRYLEENGLNTVGIFRVSTSKKRVRQLREDFDKGSVTTIDPDVCPHDIATLLKEFFRDLPEPLLCRHLYKGFLQTQSIRNRRLQLEGLSHMIHLLPVANRDTLYVLLKFLAKVACAANDTKTFDGQILSHGNKMDSTNLATVIAPNILHCIKTEQFEEQEMAERADVINIIRIMIDHFEDLFIVSSDDMNELYTTMMDIYPLQLDYLLDRLYLRQEEDIDSGSSIPPLSPPYHTQHISATFSDDEKPYSPTSSTATTTISTIELPKRVVYSREDILHGPDAGKGGLSSRRLKEREMRARMKYQDPDKPMRRRRQSDRTETSGDLSSSSSTHESHQYSSGIGSGISIGERDYYVHTMSTDATKTRSSSIDSNASDVFESVTRRMSSPISSHGGGVLTASLKIPVQMQSSGGITSTSSIHGQQNIQFFLEKPSNIGDNYHDLPYIEDNSSEFSDEVARRNTIFQFPQRQSVTITTKRLDEVQTINAHQKDDTKSSNITKLTLSSKEPLPSSSTKIPHKKSQLDTKKPTSSSSTTRTIQMSSSTGQITSLSSPPGSANALKAVKESNYTASISSIGSNVLRSKTADFERMSDSNKKSRISAATMNIPALQTTHNVQSLQAKIQSPQQQAPITTNISISLKTSNAPKKKSEDVTSSSTNTTSSSSGSSEKRSMPIYKRQEIISSVQRTAKK